MKRKSRRRGRTPNPKSPRNRHTGRVRSKQKNATKKRSSHKNLRRRSTMRRVVRRSIIDPRALAVLADMRQGVSLAKAARQYRIKQSTVQRYVGYALYRSGSGKPWKARKSDQLSALMTILTEQGPIVDAVRGSAERTRLGRYDIALRNFRAGADHAVEELQAFKGQYVGGHKLITDLDLLIQLEEAGRLDFDELYYSAGARR